jgi:hypothetical protein
MSMKKRNEPIGIEPANFRLVAQSQPTALPHAFLSGYMSGYFETSAKI